MRYLPVALLCSLLAPPLMADIITPSGVTATSQFGLGIIVVDSLIDGSGLNGEGSIEGQLHDNIDDHMWFSGCQDAGIPGGTPEGEECADPFGVAPVNEQIVEFELDAEYDLDSAVIWQYNEFNPDVGPLPGRGVKTFELLVSPTLTGEFTSVGNFELAIAEPGTEEGAFTAAAQAVSIGDLPGTESVRRVRFNILEAQGEGEAYVGLSEVRFDGSPVGTTGTPQIGGDCNQDGKLDIADVVCTVNFLFQGFDLLQTTPQEPPCSDDDGNVAVLDVNGDAALNLADVTGLAAYFFGGGSPPVQGTECFAAVESCAANVGCE